MGLKILNYRPPQLQSKLSENVEKKQPLEVFNIP